MGSPIGVEHNSSLRITMLPLIIVDIGQPVTSMPSNGVHFEIEHCCSLVMVFFFFKSTIVKSAS